MKSRLDRFISGSRMAQRLEELAGIGGLADGGMWRLPYSPEERAAHELLGRWLGPLVTSVRSDAAGNLIARRSGTEEDAPAVMVGSHLDTQPSGGRFDGIAGTIAALEVAEAFAAAGVVTQAPVDFVAWAGEEGSGRFDLGLIGSRAMVGELLSEHLKLRCRFTDQTLGDAMRGIGIAPEGAVTEAMLGPSSVRVVLELHIEQGPYLERAKKQIGVVTSIAGNIRLPIRISGIQGHSGAMPMDIRRDALSAAAEVLLAIESAAARRADPPVVATAGFFEHSPSVIAIIPREARMTVDVRSTSERAYSDVADEIRAVSLEIAERRGVDVEFLPTWGVGPTTLDSAVASTLADICESQHVQWQTMPSGAGHDTMMLGRRFPAGMLFVPSVNGVSHAREELTRIDDLVAGTRALAQAVAHFAIAA